MSMAVSISLISCRLKYPCCLMSYDVMAKGDGHQPRCHAADTRSRKATFMATNNWFCEGWERQPFNIYIVSLVSNPHTIGEHNKNIY